MSDSTCLLTDDPLWIAAPTSWRDACFSLPATRALAELRTVHVFCPADHENFWKSSGIPEVHGYNPSIKPRALSGELDGVQQCLIWEDGLAARAAAGAKIPSRLGLPAEGLAKSLTQPITLTQRPGPSVHGVQRFLDVAVHLGAGPFEGRHFAPLQSSVPRQSGSLLIAPDSDDGSHFNWPAERWIQLLKALPLKPERVRIHGTGPIARELAAATDFEVIPELELPQFAAFERCLAADSSIPHLAAAFGVTCAVLFGPGDPEKTRPLGKQHLSIRKKAECSPCGLSRCALDLRCQLDLDVERVVNALGDC